VQVRLGSIYSL